MLDYQAVRRYQSDQTSGNGGNIADNQAVK